MVIYITTSTYRYEHICISEYKSMRSFFRDLTYLGTVSSESLPPGCSCSIDRFEGLRIFYNEQYNSKTNTHTYKQLLIHH